MKKTLFSLFVAALGLMGTTANAQNVQVDLNDVEPMNPEIEALAQQTLEINMTDPDAANKVFTKLYNKVKKSKEQCVAAGKFFVDNNIYPCVKQLSELAYKTDATYIPALKLCAAYALMRRDYGAAGSKVDEILMQDENNIEAIRLSARIYKYVNPYVAIEQLEKIMTLEPNNWNAYKEMGDIQYTQDEFKKACEYYATYFQNTPVAELNILSAEQYCNSLIATNNWQLLSQVAKTVAPLKEDDVVFKRARFYSDIETYQEASSHESIKFITEQIYGDSTYIYRDYAYAAEYAKNNDNLEAAVEYYKKGLAIDEKQLPAYQQIASLYRRLKKIDEALEYYNKYMELKGDKVDLADERGLLQIYIAAKNGASTIEEKQAYADKGDVIAQRIITEKPDSYQGPFYRAQLWIFDSQNAEEKPYEYYQKALELIGDNADYDSIIVQCATYCAFYNLKTNNDAKCLEFCDIILKYEPDNRMANQFKQIIGG